MKYQRGQAVVSHSLIYFIIALMVLVGLLVYLTLGKEIIPRQDTNLDDLASQCDTLCSLKDQEGFCENIRPLVIKGKKVETETCASLARDYPNIFQGCSFFSCSNSQAYSFYSYVSSGGFIQQSTGLLENGVILNVFNTQMEDVLPDAFKVSLDDITEARAILNNKGILSGADIDAGIGPRFSSALILFQLEYLGKDKVTGLPNKETLDELAKLKNSDGTINLPSFQSWGKPEPTDWSKSQGSLNINDLVVLPSAEKSASGKTLYAFVEKETAIAWAFLIREAMEETEPELDLERFVLVDADGGYRPLYNQMVVLLQYGCCKYKDSCKSFPSPQLSTYVNIPAWDNKDSAKNWIEKNYNAYCNNPGELEFNNLLSQINTGALKGTATGAHSRGTALDFNLKNNQNIMSDVQGKWLEENGRNFGFCPYLNKDTPEPNDYIETWHWEYKGVDGCS